MINGPLAIGANGLGGALSTFTTCPHCTKRHKVRHAISTRYYLNEAGETMTEQTHGVMQYVKCGKKIYLVGIHNQQIKK